jgi:hypothetical protein
MNSSAVFRCVVTLAAAILVAGCGGSSGPGDGNGGDASFAGDVQPLFTANCSAASCHGAAESAGLKLQQGSAYQELVGVASTSEPVYLRVKADDPDSSYVIIKLEGNQSVGARMPFGGAPLSAGDIQTVRDWIEQGAADN